GASAVHRCRGWKPYAPQLLGHRGYVRHGPPIQAGRPSRRRGWQGTEGRSRTAGCAMNKRTIEGLLDLFAVRRDAPGAADAGTSDRAGSLRPPAPPLAKRLNRNALTVAAVLMGMTVLTSVVVLNTGNGGGSANAAPIQAAAPVATPPEPTFLDRPVTAAPAPRAPSPMTETGQNPGIPWDAYSAGTGGLPSGSGAVEHSRQRE